MHSRRVALALVGLCALLVAAGYAVVPRPHAGVVLLETMNVGVGRTDTEEAVIQLGSRCGYCLGLRTWMFWADGIPHVSASALLGYGQYIPVAIRLTLILLTMSIYWHAGLLRSLGGLLLPMAMAAVNLAANVAWFVARA